jgi:hypothetical protein
MPEPTGSVPPRHNVVLGEDEMKMRVSTPVVVALAMALAGAIPAFAQEAVTVDNFKRAETHYYMKAKARQGALASFATIASRSRSRTRTSSV